MGARITQEELAQLCLRIEERGGCNINLVTGTQFAPAIVEAVTQARKAGLSIPVVWNSSGFETLETVSLLEQCVDIYLPDVKTIDATYAEELALPRSYPQSVAPAVEEMHRQKPLRYQDDVLRSGLIVRHLVYPELLENTKAVLTWYASTVEQGALLSVLAQFMPGDRDEETSIPKRSLTEEEYTTVISWLDELDIEEGFVQEYEPSGEWYPDFSTRAVFPSPQFELLWHWKDRI
jgi:putative pyruvate formate lyase activating enzyme